MISMVKVADKSSIAINILHKPLIERNPMAIIVTISPAVRTILSHFDKCIFDSYDNHIIVVSKNIIRLPPIKCFIMYYMFLAHLILNFIQRRKRIMNKKLIYRNIIGHIFIKLSQLEGKRFDEEEQETFIQSLFFGSGVVLPLLTDILEKKTILPWEELKTGDLAVYSDGIKFILGIVIGEVERQFSFVDPETSIVRIVDYDECIFGHNYINGVKVISNV